MAGILVQGSGSGIRESAAGHSRLPTGPRTTGSPDNRIPDYRIVTPIEKPRRQRGAHHHQDHERGRRRPRARASLRPASPLISDTA